MMRFLRNLFALLILLLMVTAGALFALQNTTPVPLDLLVIQLPERTLSLWLLLALALGVVIGLAAGAFMMFGLRARLVAARRQKERLAVEVDRLRKVGLSDSE